MTQDWNPIQRRHFLKMATTAVGGLGIYPALSMAAEAFEGHPLAPKKPHFDPKAENLILIFLTGGFSHIDTFDPKPELNKRHGQKDNHGTLIGSQFKFEHAGQCGMPISELFTHMRGVADDLCVIRTLHTDIGDHFQATLAMHTGSPTVPLPSIGAWMSYGLGTKNPNLPAYMVLCEHLPYTGAQVWDSSFLPPFHQGVRIEPGDNPVRDLKSTARNATLQELEREMLRDVNRLHAEARPGDLNLTGRMTSFDIAQGMMREAPKVFDLSEEKDKTLEKYGLERGDNKSFAWQCLVARRLVESGVRVVQLVDTGASNNWDAHGNMEDHRKKAERVDQPIAALIADLKQRGSLDKTLIALCTEFGRTPWADGSSIKGRSHHSPAFTCLLAGAGVKGGTIYGETDDIGAGIVSNGVHVHDYHATILHLMGFDHEKLTYRYAGRDFRLTDVHGNVVKDVLS